VVPPPSFAVDQFLRFAELEALLRQVSAAHLDLMNLVEIGRSHEGRPIWLCEITNQGTGAASTKPALWVDAAIHATELTATVSALHLLRRLVDGYGHDDLVTRLLDTRSVYIVPRLNPDGAELALADSPRWLRSSVRRWPWSDYEAPGLEVADVDGDGRILSMRIADPNGPWRPHPDEPRVMVLRGPADPGGPGCYRVLMEGTIEGWDGVHLERARPPEGLDLNRNFPAGWRPTQAGAGPAPLSEPEVRSVVDAVVARPNVGVYLALHTFGGFLFRPSSMRPSDQLPRDDVRLLNLMGSWLTERNGYPVLSVYEDGIRDKSNPMSGAGDDWAFDHLGLVTFTPEIWDIGAAAGLGRLHPINWEDAHPVADDLTLVRFNDEQLGGRYCVPWYPFAHPQLGPVELGGWDTLPVWRNAPIERREAEVEPLTEWYLTMAAATPRLELLAAEVHQHGDGTWRVRVVIANTGWLPTNITQTAIDQRVVLPVVADLTLPDGVTLTTGRARIELGQLAGRALRPSGLPEESDGSTDRALAEWIVTGPPGASVSVRVVHQRAGTVEVSLDLGGLS
jgi:murein tripeptide amidase MpaA